MRIVILAAGYGTRLYPLTHRIAKPLVPVNGIPMINFLMRKIEGLKKRFPIGEIIVVVNNKFYKSFLKWKDKYNFKVTIYNDGSNSPDDRRGAIRDIKFAMGKKKGDWLVLGGDNLFEDDLSDFMKFSLSKNSSPCIGVVNVGSKKEATRFGIVKLNAKGQIVQMQEKPKKPASTLAATCIYYFPEKSIKLLNEFIRTKEWIDAAGKYISWLSEETKVYGRRLKGQWLDIGHFDSLDSAKKIFK